MSRPRHRHTAGAPRPPARLRPRGPRHQLRHINQARAAVLAAITVFAVAIAATALHLV